MSRIGVCVICFPAHKADPTIPLGMVGRVMGRRGEDMGFIRCNACNGKGFAHFRSDKK